MSRVPLSLFLVIGSLTGAEAQEEWSGVYPHLTMWNAENECGTGAVVLWQGSLWAITYAPHRPQGSSDKLYEITADLRQKIYSGSVGGTPANRMIHRESNQLLIGPYVIDAKKQIRVIPPTRMFGRLTGTARHLSDPANKVYYATMEEGLYEVDVRSLAVRTLIRDGNPSSPATGTKSQLPGYHGKGLYLGQGVLVYANNGDRDPRVRIDPTVPSGALATWKGEGDWQLIRRNQFTEVTGPGGILGNPNAATDPLWSLGWDAKSVLLALRENDEWHFYRLPKGSHSYDGAHGWNTEWPRIREIGEDHFLATMHGTFWNFPPSFSRANSAGISPRSNYLKVVGDFCRRNDHVVLGCDDSAASEFLNTRNFKAERGGPGESNSNLWFVKPSDLDGFGPVIGRGSVWLRDTVTAGTVSEPYLFTGYDHRQLYLAHGNEKPVTFVVEIDREGTNTWTPLREVIVPAGEATSIIFEPDEQATWVRLMTRQNANEVTAHFQYRNDDSRGTKNASLFVGLVDVGSTPHTFGVMRSLSHNRLGLVATDNAEGEGATYYELTPKMKLVPLTNADIDRFIADVAQPTEGISVDRASVIVVEDGKRYRLPKDDRYVRAAKAVSELPTLENQLRSHLAIGAKVTTSSTHQNYLPKHAVDGSIAEAARWIGNNDGDVWIELDLGTPKTFRSLWVVSGWKQSPEFVANDFDVQVKTGDEWQTVPEGSIRGNRQVQREIVFDKPITTRHLRLLSPTKNYFRIYEIAPFGDRIEVARPANGFTIPRICREVATERDLLNLHGTFYELPARNAQGVAKIRPIATHYLAVHDFCSHNGLLLLTGLDADTEGHHVIRSEDGRAAIWAGVVDDLWKLGKPRGEGGPWHETPVDAEVPSDPYLMTGYDRKRVALTSSEAATIRLEVDVDGTGLWLPYRSFSMTPNEMLRHEFPTGFGAYWVRAVSDTQTTATVTFTYD